MQTTFTTPMHPVHHLSLKASFLKIKKMLLTAAFLVAFAFFATPVSGHAFEPSYTYIYTSNSSVQANSPVTFSVLVESGAYVEEDGTVTFTYVSMGVTTPIPGGTNVPITDGTAAVSTIFTTAGNYNIVATYTSAAYGDSPSSATLIQTVTQPPPTTINTITANTAYSNAGTVQFTATFGTVISGISAANFSLATTGSISNAGISDVSTTLGSTYTITVSTGTGDGAIGLNLDNDTSLTPLITTSLPFTGGTMTMDRTPPVATISAPSAAIVYGTGPSSVTYTVTYADANFNSSNLTAPGITLNQTGTATGTIGVAGSGTSYIVTISNITGIGTLGISVGAGYASDMAGNTDAGAGPSQTTNVLQNVSLAISYPSPKVYPINGPIPPLMLVKTAGTSAFAATSAGSGLALDYNGNAYIVANSGGIIQYPPNNGAPVTVPGMGNASSANIAVATISATTSTLIFGNGANIQAMDYINGTFQTPVNVVPGTSSGNLVAATHPASGPEIAMITSALGSQITFVSRTAGVWSPPTAITNAFPGSAMAINTYQGGLMLAYIGTDNYLYYATYSGGSWSPVTPRASPNINMSGVTAFALDAQGNVWYGSGTSINVLYAGTTSAVTFVALPVAPNAIAFDIPGNLNVNFGNFIEVLQVPGNFQVSPSLPAGLSLNSATGTISGTPTAFTPASNYTVTATAGGNGFTATVNIQTVTTDTLSYGSAVNATIGTAITTIMPTSSQVAAPTYNNPPTIFASVNAPSGLAVDIAGNVYVESNTGILKYGPGANLLTTISSSVTAPLAADAAGNLYAFLSNISLFGFAVFPPGSTTPSYVSNGYSGYGAYIMGGAATSVSGMTVDGAGDVYAASPSANAVIEYSNGKNGGANGAVGIGIGDGFTSVSGIAADAAGNVYVADAGAGTIDLMPANRSQWTTLASGLGAPASICIDGAGNLYFSDNSANTISELPAGSTTPVLIASGLGAITAVAVDGQGNLYAADNTNNVIDKFSPSGGFFINPVLPPGLSFNGATGVISGTPTVAAAAVNYTITAYNPLGSASAIQNIAITAAPPTLAYSGAPRFTTGEAIIPLTPTSTGVAAPGYNAVPTFTDFQFGTPFSIAVDTSLNVYVADPFNPTEGALAAGGINDLFPKGNGTYQTFYNPSVQITSVAVDSTANLYINKGNGSGVSRLTPYPYTSGGPVETVLAGGYAYSLATDRQGNLFGARGSTVIQYISPGVTTTVASGFNSAVGLAIDGSGNMFVSDRGNNTLYKVPAGSSTPIAVATGFAVGNSALIGPVYGRLAADGTGNIFIADAGNGVVKELPAGGGAVATVITNLQLPTGMAVDINGALYVADLGFSQVRKYTPGGGYYISPSLPAGLSFNNATGVISGTPTAATPVKDYKITAYNASGSTQIKVRFGVAPPNSNLTGLTTSAGSLSPAFATATTGYSVSVPYTTLQTTVTPTTLDGNATVTVNGTAVVSGSASGAIALSVGANTITIVVTASDHSSTQTYTITVNRGAASNNAMLSNVGVGYVTVNGNVEAVVTPTTSDANATVTVNGVTVASGAASSAIPLSPGSNTITIVVTAQDGLTKTTYKITVYGPLGSTSTLSALTISAGTLSGGFAPGTTSYTDAVTNPVASVTVTPTTTDPNATVTVDAAAVTSGTASNAIGLIVGNNTISTVVTAQDGVTTTTYTITVTRAAYPAALTALAVNTGTYSPAFAQATLNYTETIPYTTAQIAITPTTAYPAATVTVNGTAVTSGTASPLITLPVGANTINVVVTASDGVTQQTYTLVVTRLPSTNATLSAITLNHGTLSPTFAAGTFNYTATVPYATTSVTLKPVAGNGSATIKVNGTAVTSNTASGAITLNVGSNVITTIVTAQDGVTMDAYTVTITRLPVSTNATLAGIVPNKGTLSPAFAAATNNYTVIETNGTASVGITPTAADPTATITVNGTAVASGVSSAAIALSVGSNTITILVTAQDGVTTDTYTLNVIRPSTNAKLSNLVPSSGTLSPVFATATTAYTASVANSVTSITLTPTIAAAGATVLINGTAVASGSPSGAIALSVGSNTITTVVTAQDGVTTFTYTVTVTRAKSSNANLVNITLNKGTLSPAFASATTSYTDMVTNGITAVTLTPTVQDNTATLTVNGTPVISGSASGSLALVVGSNIETVVVTAQDGVTTQTYTVNVIRPSTNDKLANLTISAGTLSPAFVNYTTSYTVSETATVNSITLTPTVAVTGSTVKINGTAVASGTSSAAIPLSVGANTITIVVTAQDGITTNTYTVAITRAALSTNASLSNLTPSKGSLSPLFTTTTVSYTDVVTNSTSSVTLTPTLADATATVTINGTTVKSGVASGAILLSLGSNNVAVVVTAQDGVTTKTYTVNVIRPSTNAKLANLTTNAGTVTPVFNPAATSYTLSVSNATASITVTPTVAVTGSTVAVNGGVVTSGSPSGAIALSVGSNTITTIVTAQDGVTTNTYTLKVTRAAGSANIPDAAVGVTVRVQNFEPLPADDGINVHQGLSPNGDGINDFLMIDNITHYPDNNLKIMNRNGQLVYEAKGYDNATKVFDGHSNKNGQMQLPGTYFYQLDYTVGGIIKHKTGYLVLKY